MEAVLVIDDDADTRRNLRDILELDNLQVETAGTIAEALRRADWARFAAVILDRRLPDGSSEDFLPRLKQLAPAAAVIIVTGYADLEGVIAAIHQGAADYLLKPINADLLRSRLAGVLERKRTAEEIVRLNKDLQHRVTELQTLLDVIPIGIAIAQDPECRRIHVNPALARLLGLDPRSSILDLLQAAGKGVEVRDVERDIVHPDGGVVNLFGSATPLFDDSGRPRGAIGAFLDVTERKRAQEQILQSERLAAIGQMMTGLAHESGNALARSQSCLEMLAWEVEDRPEALDLIGRIQKAQDHLKQLYEEVRGYAAPLKLDREVCNLAWIWRQAWDHLALARRGRDASLHEEIGVADLDCALDPFRLEQVFRNVLDNALAACRDPVRIEVRVAACEIKGCPAVRVTVRDNGPGLNPEQRQRIFDPFFTTKTKGTGLGMAIAKRIMEAHGGQIAVGAPTLPGAEIVITLPRERL